MVVREVPMSAEDAWDRLTDWPQHSPHAPFTTVRRTTDGIVARTALGRFGFDDPMTILDEQRPSHCSLVKTGSVVRGDVDITIESIPTGARVTWIERIDVRGLPKWCDGLIAVAGRSMFGRVIDRLLA